jgi:prepilin peptidase CpaA
VAILQPGLNAALVALLIYVIVDDLRFYRIRNVAVLALLAVSVVSLVMGGTVALPAHALFALIAFAALAAAYARNLLGGGDAKLLAVAFFWIGPSLAVLFAVALFGLTLLYWAGARLSILPHRLVGGRMKIPFGPSIACAWIVTILASGRW